MTLLISVFLNQQYSSEINSMNKAPKKKAVSVIKWMFAIPISLIALIIVVIICFEANKIYWDYQVQNMCDKDGGEFIYENRSLNIEEYENLKKNQGSIAPNINRANTSTPYVSELVLVKVREGFIKIHRYEMTIKSQLDNKILGKRISYARIGGDFPTGIAERTTYICPEFADAIEKNIFIIEGAQ